jgi:hypothetical protein
MAAAKVMAIQKPLGRWLGQSLDTQLAVGRFSMLDHVFSLRVDIVVIQVRTSPLRPERPLLLPEMAPSSLLAGTGDTVI